MLSGLDKAMAEAGYVEVAYKDMYEGSWQVSPPPPPLPWIEEAAPVDPEAYDQLSPNQAAGPNVIPMEQDEDGTWQARPEPAY